MRIIVHVDMDAFYAAVEERYNPALRGLPVAVGADPKEGKGRGVVTTANYMARRFGIHSALPITRAWRLAEAARKRGETATVFIHPNFPLYREVSARIMQIFEGSADSYEEASIDEAYLDVSSLGNFAAAVAQMSSLKAEISEKEGLGCSIGIAPNKLIAKIASGYKKPDGLTLVTPEMVREFLDACLKRPEASMSRRFRTSGHESRSENRKHSRRTPEAFRSLRSGSMAWRSTSSPGCEKKSSLGFAP